MSEQQQLHQTNLFPTQTIGRTPEACMVPMFYVSKTMLTWLFLHENWRSRTGLSEASHFVCPCWLR
ncbi:unnamed protein product [Dicrocoelium dendriticum]|nr:unnamed protein product [Dicrocoelium dendriticum]